MATRGIVAAQRIRLTSTNRCGLPTIAGAAASATAFTSYVFDGFVTLAHTLNLTEAQEQTSQKASGDDCVTYKTPQKLRDESITLTLCGVDDHVLEFLSSVTTVLNESTDPEGYFIEKVIDPEVAFGIELWNLEGDAASCPDTPETDAYFASAGAGTTPYGYHVWPAVTDAVLSGDVTYGLENANLTITGTAKFAPLWGTGPYPVRLNSETGTSGRLLVPFSNERTSFHGRTLLAMPDIDDEPQQLTRPTPYFGPVTP